MKKQKKNSEAILNIAAGNIAALSDTNKQFDDYFMISNDISYFDGTDSDVIESEYFKWQENKNEKIHMICTMDTFEFMSRTVIMFDRICVYRFLEHVKRTDVLYFLYLISRVLKSDGLLDIIVPNYTILANRILNEKVYDSNFEKEDILTTTELLNDKEDPHCSIWTKDRIEKFLTLEDRFEIDKIDESYNFDGRDIYIRVLARRV